MIALCHPSRATYYSANITSVTTADMAPGIGAFQLPHRFVEWLRLGQSAYCGNHGRTPTPFLGNGTPTLFASKS